MAMVKTIRWRRITRVAGSSSIAAVDNGVGSLDGQPEICASPLTLSPLQPNNALFETYEQVLLAAEPNHVIDAIKKDKKTLIVTSDWLLWRQCVETDIHAVHIESGLKTWSPDRGNSETFYLDACKWMYEDGIDKTLFKGVSLGKQFNGHIPLFKHAWLRLFHGLSAIVQTYQPKVLIFRSLQMEYDFLDQEMIARIIEDVANHAEVTFLQDRRNPSKDRFTFPVSNNKSRAKPKTGLLPMLRRFVIWGIDLGFRARSCFSNKFNVLVVHNPLFIQALLEAGAPKNLTPLLISDTQPKSIRHLLYCLKQGIGLASMQRKKLTAQDLSQIETIFTWIEKQPATTHSPLDQAILSFVKRELVESGWMHDRAEAVAACRAFLRRNKCTRIVVGHAENMVCQLLVEVGRDMGIPSDEILNGGFMHSQPTDVRCHDGNRPAPLDRLLAWGSQNELWLEQTTASVGCARTGYPALAQLKRCSTKRGDNQKRALILPLMVDQHDLLALYSNTFAALIEVIQALQKSGFDSFRIKLHPGFPKTASYFRDILAHFKIDAEIKTGSGIEPHVDWADVVVGPINSGALVETYALGRPYFAFWGTPSSLRPALFSGISACTSGSELFDALSTSKHGTITDSSMETYTSWSSISDPIGQFWKAIDDAVTSTPKYSSELKK